MSGPIGTEIRILRERLQLSAKDLAERVGLSPSQMSRLESGQRRVDTSMLTKLARALEIHPSYFFRDFGPPPETLKPLDVPDGPNVLGRFVRQERRKLHLTADELAQRITKGRIFVQDLEQGRHDMVSGEVLGKIAKALKLPVERLLDAQRQEVRQLRGDLARLQDAHAGASDGAPVKGIPIVEADDGGPPVVFEDGKPVGRVVDHLVLPGLRVREAFAVQWRGDDMKAPVPPSFEPGDLLVFSADRAPRHREFVWAVLQEGPPTFRQLFLDPGGVRLQPLNLDHPPRTLDRDDLRELFLLVARLSSFGT